MEKCEDKLVASGVQQILSIGQSDNRKYVLSGRTFLITRTLAGNRVEREKLEKFGARVVELNSIKISPPKSWKKIDKEISRLEDFDWVIFTSANGVRMFFQRCARRRKALLKRMGAGNFGTKFACVGPSTRRALEDLGYACSFQPKEFLTASLGKELSNTNDLNGKRILLARAERANNEIGKILKNHGASVYEAQVYRTTPGRGRKISHSAIRSLTDVTVTSPSTVDGLLNIVSAKELNSGIKVHCIGPITADRAKSCGMLVTSVAKEHTIDGLIASIVSESRKDKFE